MFQMIIFHHDHTLAWFVLEIRSTRQCPTSCSMKFVPVPWAPLMLFLLNLHRVEGCALQLLLAGQFRRHA